LSDIFTKLRAGRVSRVRTLTPNFTVLTPKMWAYTAKIAKICNFWYKFAQKGYTPLSDFYKIWLGGESPRFAPSCQISSMWVKNVGVQPPKSPNLIFFSYKFAQKGYTPLSNFYNILPGGGAPGSHSHAKLLRDSFKNVALRPQKSPKIIIIGKNLPLVKILGVDRKT